MSENRKTMRRIMLLALLLLVPVFAAVVKTTGHQRNKNDDSSAAEKWEYLVLARPSNTNFSATGNSEMRKADAPFHESFVLEVQLDKVGTKGWELVSVAGPPTDPIYYFKRRK